MCDCDDEKYKHQRFFGHMYPDKHQCHGCKCMRTWHEFFREQIDPEEKYVIAAPYEKELRDIVARYHVEIYLRDNGVTELWNHSKNMELVKLQDQHSCSLYVCTNIILPHGMIAIQYNQSSKYYGAYTIGCDGGCKYEQRPLMRWRIYTELQRMNPSFQMTEYTEKELYDEFIKHHNKQTTTALMIVWMRTQSSLFSKIPHDLFRWFVKKYFLKPMEAFCYTGPRLTTHSDWLLMVAKCLNAMLIADGSAPLRFND
jgi:hypothetical protein